MVPKKSRMVIMKLVAKYCIAAIIMGAFVFAVKLLSSDSKRLHHRRDEAPPPLSYATSTRIILWAVPRSASTTFLLSMSQSPGVTAWFEPYLFASMQERVDESQLTMQQTFKAWFADIFIPGGYDVRKTSYDQVKAKLESYGDDEGVIGDVFVKDMVKGITGKFQFIPDGYTHTFLIRHPLRVFTLYKKKHNAKGDGVRENKGLRLTEFSQNWIPSGYFFKEIHELVTYVRDVLKQKVVIVDTDDLLEDPEKMLKMYCKEVGMTFENSMLEWNHSSVWEWMMPKDTRLTWSWRTFIYGYNPTHKTSFSKVEFGDKMALPDRADVDEDVLTLSDASEEYYNELYQHRLRLA